MSARRQATFSSAQQILDVLSSLQHTQHVCTHCTDVRGRILHFSGPPLPPPPSIQSLEVAHLLTLQAIAMCTFLVQRSRLGCQNNSAEAP